MVSDLVDVLEPAGFERLIVLRPQRNIYPLLQKYRVPCGCSSAVLVVDR